MTNKYLTAPVMSVDLRCRFSTARDQGPRPLCLAFAASDLHSFAHTSIDDLSIEYLSYYAFLWLGHSSYDLGLTVSSVTDTLENHGQPLECELPYDLHGVSPKKPSGPYSKIYNARASMVVPTLSQIKTSLDNGVALVMCLQLTRSFFSPSPIHIVEVDGTFVGHHAVVAVGYGEYPDGEVCLLIRNSWGVAWGDQGHAWLTTEFVDDRLSACLGVAV
jgi:hypothetical protein